MATNENERNSNRPEWTFLREFLLKIFFHFAFITAVLLAGEVFEALHRLFSP